MTAHAAVGVHDDLAAGQAGVALRSADDETAGRVDEKFRFLREHFRRENFLDDILDAEFFDLRVLDIRRVLRGDDDVGDGHRLVVFINDGDLRLRVGAQPGRTLPLLRICVSSRPRRCANMIGAGISSGVSLQA